MRQIAFLFLADSLNSAFDLGGLYLAVVFLFRELTPCAPGAHHHAVLSSLPFVEYPGALASANSSWGRFSHRWRCFEADFPFNAP
jgi:hypothetical protein